MTHLHSLTNDTAPHTHALWTTWRIIPAPLKNPPRHSAPLAPILLGNHVHAALQNSAAAAVATAVPLQTPAPQSTVASKLASPPQHLRQQNALHPSLLLPLVLVLLPAVAIADAEPPPAAGPACIAPHDNGKNLVSQHHPPPHTTRCRSHINLSQTDTAAAQLHKQHLCSQHPPEGCMTSVLTASAWRACLIALSTRHLGLACSVARPLSSELSARFSWRLCSRLLHGTAWPSPFSAAPSPRETSLTWP